MENVNYNERVAAVLARSPWAEALVAAGAISTAALVAALPVALEARLLALGWIAMTSLRALVRLRPGTQVDLHHEGEAHIGGRPGRLRQGSFVAPWLAIVRWRPAGAWFDRTLLVAPGMLPAEDFRRLRVLLRFGDRPLGPLSRPSKRTKGTDLGGDAHAS